MAVITMLGESFCLYLALGVSFFSFLANTKESGAGLIKLIMGVCLGSSILALILHLTYASWLGIQSIFYYVGIITFFLIYLFHKDKKSLLMKFFYLVHTISLLLLLWISQNTIVEHLLYMLSSCLFLGNITYAMVMGHWYLVTPKLSEKPLQIATYFMWLLLIVKIVVTVVGYGQAEGYFIEGTRLGGGYAFNWLMLTMRIGWGYIVIGIMSYFAYRLISMRSIQSATGILYAMTFFVFVGELISLYLFLQYGLYL